MPKIAPAIIAAVSVRKTRLAILVLQNKIYIKSQGLKSSHNLGEITVTALSYVLWKHNKAIICLDLMQGGWTRAHSLLKVEGALWGCGCLYSQWEMFLKHFLSSTTAAQHIMVEPTFILVQ